MNNVIQPTGNALDKYLDEIRDFEFLSPEKERELAVRWRDRRDEAALRTLAGSHLRLVVKIARGYRGYGLPLADLISEGNVGLMQAVEKFDPDRGFRLATYAMWWIRAAIQEYILRSWSLVKMGTTAAQKKLFFNLRRLKGRMQEYESGDLSPETVAEIARELDVPETEVVEMNRRMAASEASLNVAANEDGDTEWQDLLADERATPETAAVEANERALRNRLLKEGLEKLNERERHILLERRLKDNPSTLEELSQHYNVSRERVRQIEVRAFEKLQKAVKGQMQQLLRQQADKRDRFSLVAA